MLCLPATSPGFPCGHSAVITYASRDGQMIAREALAMLDKLAARKIRICQSINIR
jgi:hypothetical protein